MPDCFDSTAFPEGRPTLAYSAVIAVHGPRRLPIVTGYSFVDERDHVASLTDGCDHDEYIAELLGCEPDDIEHVEVISIVEVDQ